MKRLAFASLVLASVAPLFAHASGICDRTPIIQKEILRHIPGKRCAQVTVEDLKLVTDIDIDYSQDPGGDNYNATYGYIDDNNKARGFKTPHRISTLKDNDLQGLVNLETLGLQFTNISVFKRAWFKDLKKLVKLDISHNLIESFAWDVFWDLPNVTSIEFDSNEYFNGKTGLKDGLFGFNYKLQEVDLDENNLVTLPEKLFRKLEVRGGKVWWTTEGIPNLVHVDAGKNHITHIPRMTLYGLPRLNKVTLNGSPMSTGDFKGPNADALSKSFFNFD